MGKQPKGERCSKCKFNIGDLSGRCCFSPLTQYVDKTVYWCSEFIYDKEPEEHKTINKWWQFWK